MQLWKGLTWSEAVRITWLMSWRWGLLGILAGGLVGFVVGLFSKNPFMLMLFSFRGSDSNGAKSHVKGRSWDRLASQDLSPSVSQGTIWRYVAVDRRLGYA